MSNQNINKSQNIRGFKVNVEPNIENMTKDILCVKYREWDSSTETYKEIPEEIYILLHLEKEKAYIADEEFGKILRTEIGNIRIL